MSTVKKSQASIACDCARKNSAHVGPDLPGGRIDTVLAEYCPYRRGRELDAHSGHFPLDAPVAPGGVLIRQAKDDRHRARRERRPPGPPARVRPVPSKQVAVPSQEGLRPDKETSPASHRDTAAQAREDRPVRWPQSRTSDLAAQDPDLVAEHDDLDGKVLLRAA